MMAFLTRFFKRHYPVLLLHVAICALLGLTGCAKPIRPVPVTLNPEQQHKLLTHLTHWTANGRLAVTNQQEGATASMTWSQHQQRFTIQLYGPLNLDGFTLSGTPDQVQLTTSDGQHHTADSPEALLQQQTGLTLPLSGLIYWLKGLPSPHSKPDAVQKNAQQQLTLLEQDGWHIQFLQYAYHPPLALPYKIHLQHQQLKIKFIINQWTLHDLGGFQS